MSKNTKMVEIFRAAGEAEAHVVKGLLDSNGIDSLLRSNAAPSVHMFTIDGMGEVRILVDAAKADEARSLIDGAEHA
jgi:hypothetical protein